MPPPSPIASPVGAAPFPKPETLKQRVLRAGGWSVAGYALSQLVRFGSNLVMTRLLAPDMFGIMSIALTVPQILKLISDLGLRQHIVQSRRGEDPAFLDTAWVVQILRSVVLWLVALGLCIALHAANAAGVFPGTSVYASPELPLLIAVSSFTLVIYGFESTKWPSAYRKFNQKRIMQIELAGQLVAVAVMVAAGVASRSVWALVAGGLVAALTTTLLSHLWMDGHPNRFRWEKDALRDLFHFGKWIFASSLMGFLAGSANLVLGGFVEPEVLGLYAIAALMLGALAGPLARFYPMVGLPALSEIARNNPRRLREVYYKLRIPGDLLQLFLAGLLFSAGQLLVDFFYDPRYSPAGGMLQVLALSLFAARYGVSVHAYLAVGLPQYATYLNAVGLVSMYSLVPTLYYIGGIQGALWGIVLSGLAGLPFVFYFNARLQLNDFRRELAVLVALPLGWLCGQAVNAAASWVLKT